MKIFIADKKENFEQIKQIAIYLAPKAEIILGEMPQGKSDFLAYNFDNEKIRNACKSIDSNKAGYGFSREADFFASDELPTESGVTFKLNTRGSSIPIWINKNIKKEEIYYFLAAICVASANGMNVVDISEKLKNY